MEPTPELRLMLEALCLFDVVFGTNFLKSGARIVKEVLYLRHWHSLILFFVVFFFSESQFILKALSPPAFSVIPFLLRFPAFVVTSWFDRLCPVLPLIARTCVPPPSVFVLEGCCSSVALCGLSQLSVSPSSEGLLSVSIICVLLVQLPHIGFLPINKDFTCDRHTHNW